VGIGDLESAISEDFQESSAGRQQDVNLDALGVHFGFPRSSFAVDSELVLKGVVRCALLHDFVVDLE